MLNLLQSQWKGRGKSTQPIRVQAFSPTPIAPHGDEFQVRSENPGVRRSALVVIN